MNRTGWIDRFGSRLLAGLLTGSCVAAAGLALPSIASAQSKPAPAVSSDVSLVPVVGAAKARLVDALSAKAGAASYSPSHHECPGNTPHIEPTACNTTQSQQLANTDCALEDQSRVDFYAFSGTSGQVVTIDMTASFDTYLFLLDPTGQNIAAQDDDSGGNGQARIVFTLTSTGTWFIAANSFDPNVFGAYTLALQCTGGGGGGGNCTPNSTTLCLNNGRFLVQANWAAPNGTSGAGTAVPETTDTGMFWFFSANNIEMIIKVVNGCGFNQRYWVFAGGLTNVQVVITVTDTANGTTKTYTNPQGTAFAPIQDTDAFATCP